MKEIYHFFWVVIHELKELSSSSYSNSYTRYIVKKLRKSKGCTVQIGRNFRARPGVVIRIDPGSKLIIGDNVHLRSNCRLRVTNKSTLIIGDNVYIARYSDISCWHKIIIHDEAIFAPYVALHDHQHKFDLRSPVNHGVCDQFKPIEIGKGVWIGMRVSVLNNVHIGDFSVIGANAVVTKDIPSGCIAGGVPARVIKKLGDKTTLEV